MSWVGRPLPRPDAAAKATGRAEYIGDLRRRGMLHGKILFSEHAHARIAHIDTTRAQRVPGVRAIVTGFDTPELRFGFLGDNRALKRDKVRQFRDEVAAVAATDPDAAAEAVSLIDVTYEPLPAVFDIPSAQRPDAPLVHETDGRGRPVSTNRLPLEYHHRSGDLDAAKRDSRWVVEGTFSTPLIQQSCMGTAGCIAELDPSGNLTMWAKTQIPFLAQRDFNRALAAMGLKGRNSRVIVPTLGGAFGTGLDTHAYEYIAILLAWRSGCPVRMLYTREEEFACLSPRQSATTRIAMGCDAEGHLTFREVHVLQDNGAYASWGATFPTVMLLPATSLYRVRAVRFDADLVYTNNTYCQAMRGYGNPEVTWAIESGLDELAEEAGIDRLELRRRNCTQPGDHTPMGLEIRSCGLAECLDRTARSLRWGEARPARRGIGLASLIHVGGSGRIYRSDGSGVNLRFDDYGNVYVASGGVEMGQGLHAALTSAVADSVGVLPDQVFVVPTDTSTCPWDVGTHASRGAFVACNAAIAAAASLRAQLFALLPEVLEGELKRNLAGAPDDELAAVLDAARAPDGLDLRDGVVTIVGCDQDWARVALGRTLRALHFRSGGTMLAAHAFYEPPSELPDWNTGMGNLSATYAFGTQGAEVEVDVDTGEVKVLKLVAVHDVGRVLNPTTLAGQCHGALAQGLGYTLYEEVRTHQGRVLNPSFRDYKIPTIHELGFEVDLQFVTTDDDRGPFGAKGVGEPGLVPTAPAIANAIYDAVGVRIRDLPITPQKVLDALAMLRPTGP